jgi:hypothetical protein
MDEQFLKTIEHLKRNRFDTIIAENTEDARQKIMDIISPNASVGVANSVTVRQIGILEALKDRGNHIIDPISMGYGLVKFDPDSFDDINRKSVDADVFLAGTNAVTEDGKLVNIDGRGNRVAGIIWNPGISIVIVSKNKIVKDVDAAFYRIKNMVTPTLANRRQLKLPCAKAGKCVDCAVIERACNITMILDKKPGQKELIVVMINEDLGLGWEKEWPAGRIDEIRHKYEQFDWPYCSDLQNFRKSRLNQK